MRVLQDRVRFKRANVLMVRRSAMKVLGWSVAIGADLRTLQTAIFGFGATRPIQQRCAGKRYRGARGELGLAILVGLTGPPKFKMHCRQAKIYCAIVTTPFARPAAFPQKRENRRTVV